MAWKKAILKCVSSDLRSFGKASRKHIIQRKMDKMSVTRAFIDIYEI